MQILFHFLSFSCKNFLRRQKRVAVRKKQEDTAKDKKEII